jgi:hypothetical protein
LTIVNAGTNIATISNNNAGSAAANRIISGTGNDISLAAGASMTFVYDAGAGASLWRATSAAAGSSGSGVTTVGAIDTQTKNANGAVIASNSIYLQTADASNRLPAQSRCKALTALR